VPGHARQAGFTPGHLFAVHDLPHQQGLNRAALSEFTSGGEFLRTFCGGAEVGTRLVGPVSLAFGPDGRLLVTSGWLTDGILAFYAGGAEVARFADGLYVQVCVDRGGRIYATQHTNEGSAVRVLDASGALLRTVSHPEPHAWFHAIAVNARGQLFVTREAELNRLLEQYDEAGRLAQTLPLSGRHHGLLSVDAHDCLYLPCPHTRRVTVLGPEGAPQECWDLEAEMEPVSVAVAPDGRAWIGGRQRPEPTADESV